MLLSEDVSFEAKMHPLLAACHVDDNMLTWQILGRGPNQGIFSYLIATPMGVAIRGVIPIIVNMAPQR